jgi:hypothetical protein
MPKIMAFVSTRKKPSTTGCVRTYRKPATIELQLGRSAAWAATSDGKSTTAVIAPTYVAESTR